MTNDQRIEAVINYLRGSRDGIGERRGHDKGCNCCACGGVLTITQGIEAIREMQAKSAGREDEYLDVYVQVSAENDRLKEELRIAGNSWNFEEGKRIIAQRDNLLKMNSLLCDKQDGLRGRLDRIEALAGELRSERAAAMIERDDLRGKLRAREKSLDAAVAEMLDLRAERMQAEAMKETHCQACGAELFPEPSTIRARDDC